jgi:SAM-dependent methyltransferase
VSIKSTIRALPIIGPLSKIVSPPKHYPPMPIAPFTSSSEYWESRYAIGGNSGAGSYNRLAEFKADVINELVERHEMDSVIEFGCGDGAQLALANYPSYTGVDVSPTIIEAVRRKFADHPHYTFLLANDVTEATKADLSLSLDVIYHLVEDRVFDSYMHQLFDASTKIVAIYASNRNEVTDSAHVRHRRFTDWIEAIRPDFIHMNTVPNRYPFDPADPDHTSFADFHIFRSTAWWVRGRNDPLVLSCGGRFAV